MNLRPTTNLVIPEQFQLPAAEQKTRFMYLYTKAYTGRAPMFMSMLWASLLFPSLVKNPKYGSDSSGVRQGQTQIKDSTLHGYLKIKKVMGKDPHFIASLPIFQFGRNSPGAALKWLTDFMLGQHKAKQEYDHTADTLSEHRDLVDQLGQSTDPTDMLDHLEFNKARCLAAWTFLDARGRAAFNECLLGLRIEYVGSVAVIFLDLKITKEEAQQLTVTPWIEIRNMDLYPLLLTWAQEGYGYFMRGEPPTAAFSISKIASEINRVSVDTADMRINEDGLSIGPNGRPYYLPAQLDNTMRYEDAYNQVGSQDDGEFALISTKRAARDIQDGQAPKIKLPVNTPVYMDWVNNKYSYTDTNGMLKVLDLVRYRPADVSHIVNLLNERIVDDEFITSLQSLGAAVGVPSSAFKPIDSDLEDPELEEEASYVLQGFSRMPNLDGWFKQASVAYQSLYPNQQIPYGKLQTNGIPWLRPIARYIKQVAAAVGANLDSVYTKFSVYGTSQRYAWLLMVSKYADKLADLKARDYEHRKAAIEQGVDPNWKMPSMPLLSQAHPIGMLPHQEKVRNIMKDSPDFALLPVQAGGGKSPLLLTDILLEIKANRNSPYLVLCPGHLVANYAREVTYFTDGRVNVIPITTYAINTTGWPRLQALLESAPRNTVVVANYDVLRYQPKDKASYVCYGTTPVDLYPVIDFLRQFRFGYVALDESHKVKNLSARTKAALELIADIPKKRLASGTMVHDTPVDLATQVAMLDPTLFGTREEFMERYGESIAGSKVTKWKPGAEHAIMSKIKSRVVVAGAMRKEWAALLPPIVQHIHAVNMTPKQKEVYDLILAETIEQIEEAAKANAELAKFLSGDKEPKTAEEQKEAALDEDEGDSIAAALKPYLARLEMFTASPGKDKLGREMLHDEDLLSPKIAYVIHRLRLHLEGGKDEEGRTWEPQEGKVLIFTNYNSTVDALWDAVPADLKRFGLKYSAATKIEDNARFESDPKIKWMIGIEASMNEGLNFQFASRLIRTESVWNPGTLEQGNSRINRPELKKSVRRKQIFYDWILTNATIDITKTARLISKVVAVGKFENTDNAAYDEIESLPIVKMDLDSIRERNTWDHLTEYNQAYAQYLHAQTAEYKDYRENYVQKFGKEPELTPIPMAPVPKDARLMKRVPYTPGLDLYGASELGLVRLDTYINSPEYTGPIYKGLGPKATAEDRVEALKDHLRTLVIHTEAGEGKIRAMSIPNRNVHIGLTTGYRIRLKMSAAFVVTRSETSTKDMRTAVLRQYGDMSVAPEVDVPMAGLEVDRKAATEQRRAEKLKQKEELKQPIQKRVTKEKIVPEETKTIAEIHLLVANGFLGLSYDIDETEENKTILNMLQQLSFRPTPEFVYAPMKTGNMLLSQFNVWRAKGFHFDPKMAKQGVVEAIQDLADLIDAKTLRTSTAFKFSKANQLQNFYRLEHKPNPDKFNIKPYPMIEDGVAYLVLPWTGQTATRNAIRYPGRGVRWQHPGKTLTYYGFNRGAVIKKIQEIQEMGIQISNIKDLQKRANKLRMSKVKVREDEDIDPNRIALAFVRQP